MANKTQVPPSILDKRVVDRYLSRGTLTREQLEAHLGELPDREPESENIAERVYGAQGDREANGETTGEG